MAPMVSVLMPVYNAEKFLRSTIQSILDQTLDDFEFLIADDASSDGSVKVIREFKDSRIKFFSNKNNLGYIKTLNILISMSQGKYLARQDNDDISAKERFELQVCFMEANPQVSLCGTNALVFGERITVTHLPEKNRHLRAALLFQNEFIHPSVMIRHQTVVDMVQPLYDEKLILAEDYAAWFRISQSHQIANLKRPLLKYRYHSGSESRLKSDQQSVKAQLISGLVFEETLGWVLSDLERGIHRKLMGNEVISIDELAEVEIFLEKVLQKNNEQKYYCHTSLHEVCIFFWISLVFRVVNVGFIRKLLIILSANFFRLSKIHFTSTIVIRKMLYRYFYLIVKFR